MGGGQTILSIKIIAAVICTTTVWVTQSMFHTACVILRKPLIFQEVQGLVVTGREGLSKIGSKSLGSISCLLSTERGYSCTCINCGTLFFSFALKNKVRKTAW